MKFSTLIKINHSSIALPVARVVVQRPVLLVVRQLRHAAGVFAVIMLGVQCAAAQSHAGFTWTLESTSSSISQKGLAYSQVFRNPSPVPAGAKITSVRVQRHASRSGYLATTLCTAPASGQCVVVQGSHVSTKVFNGMPANQPFYLTHTVMGDGPLEPPMFVRASVTVWFEPFTPTP